MSKQHGIQEYTSQESKNLKLGQAGYVFLATTTSALLHADEGHYTAVTVLEDDCEVSFTGLHGESEVMLAAPVAAGTTIYGRWNKVTVATANASAICYRG